MTCELCGKTQEEKFGSGRFCSRTCANRFVSLQNREEKNKKTSEKLKGRPASGGWASANIDREKWRASNKKTWEAKKLVVKESTPFELWPENFRREEILTQQNNLCARCGIVEWLGETLTLELDHKDGNRSNNTRDNLEFLCPNCHSLTSTWRGRNINRVKKDYISDEQMQEALSKFSSIRQALLSLGLSPKGGNYARAKRLLGKSNIPT